MLLRVYVTVLCFCSVSPAALRPAAQFRVIKEWNYINYTWPADITHQLPSVAGDYIPQNNLIAGINYYNGYYYLAIPRMKIGIPVTLARINAGNPRPNPVLEPFPSWEMNLLGNCSALQNVQNVAIDSEGLMWIIDGGKSATLSKEPNIKCLPKIIIYDIKKKTILNTYNFTQEVADKNVSFLYDLAIDDSDGGFAYITDNSRIDPGIIVYSLKQNRAWKIRDSKSMAADQSAIDFKINDVFIRTPINLAGIALGPKTDINEQNITLNEDREIFFCPISSLHLYSTLTRYLQDENNSKLQDGEFNKYVKDVGLKTSQSDGIKMDNQGVLYYGLLSTTGIARWDSSMPFASNQEVISRDEKYIQWPNSFAFDDDGNVLVLTNNLEKYVQGKMLLDEPNFRILMAYVGAKSYVFDDETLVYSVHETDKQNISITTTTTITTIKTTTPRIPMEDMYTTQKEILIEDVNVTDVNLTDVKIEDARKSTAAILVTSQVLLIMFCYNLHLFL